MREGELGPLVEALRRFNEERAWARFHDPKNLAMLLASEAGELVALLRFVAGEDADAFVRDARHRPAVEAEVADVAIALLLLCDRAGIDLAAAIRAKIEVNRRNYPVALARGHARRPASRAVRVEAGGRAALPDGRRGPRDARALSATVPPPPSAPARAARRGRTASRATRAPSP